MMASDWVDLPCLPHQDSDKNEFLFFLPIHIWLAFISILSIYISLAWWGLSKNNTLFMHAHPSQIVEWSSLAPPPIILFRIRSLAFPQIISWRKEERTLNQLTIKCEVRSQRPNSEFCPIPMKCPTDWRLSRSLSPGDWMRGMEWMS